MLLGNKKAQNNDQNWCVVLKPIPSQIGKNQVAQLMSEVFGLSLDEANDVVTNTPIIILDNLTRQVATKVKEYFETVGADMMLTNDLLVKRRYYRTVWPEVPSLSFLHDWTPPAQEKEKVTTHNESQALAPDEALHAIRSISDTGDTTPPTSTPPVERETEPVTDSKQAEELEERRQECLKLRDEVSRLRHELSTRETKTKKEDEQSAQKLDSEVENQNKKIAELQGLLSNAEERHDVLKEEYRQARLVFEQKLEKSNKEVEIWKVKVEEMTGSFESFQKEKKALDNQLKQKAQAAETLEQAVANEKRSWENRVQALSQELQQAQKSAAERDQVVSEKQALESLIEEQKKEVLEWQSKYDGIQKETQKTREAELAFKEEKRALEERLRDLEKSQLRLIRDFEDRNSEVKNWREKYEALNTQTSQLKEDFENREKIAQVNLRQLEVREQELRTLKQEMMQLNQNLTDQERAHKEALRDLRLSQKEERLKQLVIQQQRIEEEVRDREDAIRQILTDQAAIEKEILEEKQWDFQNEVSDKPSISGRLKIEKGQAFEDPSSSEEDSEPKA